MITAYNATPLARHIDTPEQAQPVYTTLDAMIADMMADAKQIRQRIDTAKMRDTTQEEVSDETIIQAVKANPGMTAAEIAEAICKPVKNTRSRVQQMARRGAFKVQIVKRGSIRMATFYPGKDVAPKVNKRRASPVRDKVIAFIKANPGCTTPELATYMGCSNRMAAAHVSEVRKVVNLRSERATAAGSHIPARHWLEDAE